MLTGFFPGSSPSCFMVICNANDKVAADTRTNANPVLTRRARTIYIILTRLQCDVALRIPLLVTEKGADADLSEGDLSI